MLTLGYLPVGDGDFPHQQKLLQGLMDSVEVEEHFHIITQFTTSNHITSSMPSQPD